MWFGRRFGWETDAKHFVFALHPLAKTLRFSSFFYLSLTAAWALEVGWSLCSLILSDGFALSSLLLQNENLGQSDLPKAETHLSVFTTSSCISGSGFENSLVEFCEWRKEKNIYINTIQMQKNWMFSPNASKEAGTSLSDLWIYMSLWMLLLRLCGLVIQLVCSVR